MQHAQQKVEKPAVVPDDGYKNANPGDTATTKGILDDAVVQEFFRPLFSRLLSRTGGLSFAK